MGNQTPVGETIGAFGPVEEMTPEQGVSVAFKSLADRAVPASSAVERLTPHARVVSAHSASSVKRTSS